MGVSIFPTSFTMSSLLRVCPFGSNQEERDRGRHHPHFSRTASRSPRIKPIAPVFYRKHEEEPEEHHDIDMDLEEEEDYGSEGDHAFSEDERAGDAGTRYTPSKSDLEGHRGSPRRTTLGPGVEPAEGTHGRRTASVSAPCRPAVPSFPPVCVLQPGASSSRPRSRCCGRSGG